MSKATEQFERDRRKRAEVGRRAERLMSRLIEAGPVGRTLSSMAEEEGWTPAQARAAVEEARRREDDHITYAPESRIFYWVS